MVLTESHETEEKRDSVAEDIILARPGVSFPIKAVLLWHNHLDTNGNFLFQDMPVRIISEGSFLGLQAWLRSILFRPVEHHACDLISLNAKASISDEVRWV